MIIKLDCHTHTKYSMHSNINPKDIPYYAKRKNINALIVLDHNTLKGALEAKKYENDNLIIFPGEEILTDEGEIIGFNIHEKIPKGLSALETLDKIKEQKGLSIIPHPFNFISFDLKLFNLGRKIINDVEILKKADFIEIRNSRNLFSVENKKAEQTAKKFNLKVTAGSDAHVGFKHLPYSEIGNAYLKFDAEFNEESILKALQKNNVEIYCVRDFFGIVGFAYKPINWLRYRKKI